MDYETFKVTFLSALAESRITTIGVHGLKESLDPRTLDRRCKAYVEGPDRDVARTFHVSGEVSWRWRAIQTARTATTEEDMLTELLGRDGSDQIETEQPWTRIDLKLRATVQHSKALAMPPPARWMSWRGKVATQFEKSVRLISAEDSRMNADGRMEILGWQGDPELTAECTPVGDLRLRGLELPAFQILRLPRQWDDSARESDEDPHEDLAAMLKRLSRGLSAWGNLVHQLVG